MDINLKEAFVKIQKQKKMNKRIIIILNIFIASLFLISTNSCKEDEYEYVLIDEVVMTWENPAELVTGLPLTETQLNATVNVPGTIVFTPELGTVLPLGENQQLKADFTPTDTEKWEKVSKTVTINIVDKYIPVITWENPAVLPVGDPLTEEQLNATADVEGVFVYTPPLGTLLPLGDNQELKVDFTPSVPTHQATSKTVYINVRDVVPLKYTANSAKYINENTIGFNVSGIIGSLGDSPSAGFTVHVYNRAKFVDYDFNISNVSFSGSTIELTLGDKVYADDKITITFNPDGNTIISDNDQPMLAFEAQAEVPVSGSNMLEGIAWAGFEVGAGANTGGAAGYWVGGDGLPWSRTTDMAASGEASMKFSGGFDVRTLYGMDFGNHLDTQPGAFQLTHKIYIEPGSDLKVLRTAVARKSAGWGDDLEAVWNVENIVRGEWVTIKQIVNFPFAYNLNDPNEKIRYSYYVEASNNPGVSGDQTFYLDDMELAKVDIPARP